MPGQFETDKFPFIKAKHFRPGPAGRRAVRVVVIHSMESAETADTAENVAKMFQTSEREASAHLCIDSNSIVQCVLDNDIAFAAPGVNSDGIHLELAGKAAQTEAQWLDEFGKLLLENAANAAAQYCLKYDIPVKHLTNDELRDKKNKGIIGHVQASKVFPPNAGHTDPGAHFPWEFFVGRVAHHHAALLEKFNASSATG